jgi:hypothetical protein
MSDLPLHRTMQDDEIDRLRHGLSSWKPRPTGRGAVMSNSLNQYEIGDKTYRKDALGNYTDGTTTYRRDSLWRWSDGNTTIRKTPLGYRIDKNAKNERLH